MSVRMKSLVSVFAISDDLFEISASGTFGGGYSGLRVSRENVVATTARELRRYGTTPEGVELISPAWIKNDLGTIAPSAR